MLFLVNKHFVTDLQAFRWQFQPFVSLSGMFVRQFQPFVSLLGTFVRQFQVFVSLSWVFVREFQGFVSQLRQAARRLQTAARGLQSPARRLQTAAKGLQKAARRLQRPASGLQRAARDLQRPSGPCQREYFEKHLNEIQVYRAPPHNFGDMERNVGFTRIYVTDRRQDPPAEYLYEKYAYLPAGLDRGKYLAEKGVHDYKTFKQWLAKTGLERCTLTVMPVFQVCSPQDYLLFVTIGQQDFSIEVPRLERVELKGRVVGEENREYLGQII